MSACFEEYLPFNHARIDVVLFQQRSDHVEIVGELREDDHTRARFFGKQRLKVADQTCHFGTVVLNPVVFSILKTIALVFGELNKTDII